MKIVSTDLRAIIERVTEIEYDGMRLFVFEYLDSRGVPHSQRIQNWECDDITKQFKYGERCDITKALYEHYRSKANSLD